MRHFVRELFSGSLNWIGNSFAILALVSYTLSIAFHRDVPIPPYIALRIAACSFICVLSNMEYRNASLAFTFRESLRDRCDAVRAGWAKLADDYQNARLAGRAATLPEPMSPAWRMSTDQNQEWLHYDLGRQQAYTLALREDLQRLSMAQDFWDARISLPELHRALEMYDREIMKLR